MPCNLAGAWFGPIAAVLGLIIEENNLGLLAKALWVVCRTRSTLPLEFFSLLFFGIQLLARLVGHIIMALQSTALLHVLDEGLEMVRPELVLLFACAVFPSLVSKWLRCSDFTKTAEKENK